MTKWSNIYLYNLELNFVLCTQCKNPLVLKNKHDIIKYLDTHYNLKEIP